MTTAAAPHDPDPRALANHEKSIELDKALRAVLKKKGFYDPEARSLRTSLRDCYEAVILTDLDFATLKDVEQHLWWNVFYRPIEEFRTKHRKASEQGDEGREAARKLATAYVRFLEEAKGYYMRLVMALQRTYGDIGVSWNAGETTEPSRDDTAHSNECTPGDCRLSIHRCLICMGDLFRYHATVVRNSKAEWRSATHHYRLAARVYPSNGNAYNQLAVMAYYTNDELRAVYYYFRSLAVKTPFVTAKENLLMLFERSRARWKKQQQGMLGPSDAAGLDPRRSAAQQLTQETASAFVRLHGLLFDKINVEQFEETQQKALTHLDSLLASRDALDGIASQPPHDQMLLHLAVLSIFSVCYLDHKHEAHDGGRLPQSRPSPAPPGMIEAMERSALRRYALATFFNVGAALLRAANLWHAENGAPTSIMLAVHVMLRWLSVRSDVAAPGRVGDAQELSARVKFFTAAAVLLGRMPPAAPQVLDSGQTPLLPEELDFQGFEPLGWHSTSSADISMKPVDNSGLRTVRLLQCCSAVSTALLANQHTRGADVQPQGMFGISAEEEEALQRSVLEFCAAVPGSPSGATTSVSPGLPGTPAAQASTSRASTVAPTEEVADDEVIVFQPKTASRPGSSAPGSPPESSPGPLTRPPSSAVLAMAAPEEPPQRVKAPAFSLFDDKPHFDFKLLGAASAADQHAQRDGMDHSGMPAVLPRPSTTPPTAAASHTAAAQAGDAALAPDQDPPIQSLFTQRRAATAPAAAQTYKPVTGPAHTGAQPGAGAFALGSTPAPMPNQLPSPTLLKPRTADLPPPAIQQQARAAAAPAAALFSDTSGMMQGVQHTGASAGAHSPAAAPGTTLPAFGGAAGLDGQAAGSYQPFGGMLPPAFGFRQLPASSLQSQAAAVPMQRSSSAGHMMGGNPPVPLPPSILSSNSVPVTLHTLGHGPGTSGEHLLQGVQAPGMRDSGGVSGNQMLAPEQAENDQELQAAYMVDMVVGEDEEGGEVGLAWRPPSGTVVSAGMRGSSTGPTTPTSSFTLFSGRSSPFPDAAAPNAGMGWLAPLLTQPLQLEQIEQRMLRQVASFPPHSGTAGQAGYQPGAADHQAALAAQQGGYPIGSNTFQQTAPAQPLLPSHFHPGAVSAQALNAAALAQIEPGYGFGVVGGVGSNLPMLQTGHTLAGAGGSGGFLAMNAGAADMFAGNLGPTSYAQAGYGTGGLTGAAADMMQLQALAGGGLQPTRKVFQTANPFVP